MYTTQQEDFLVIAALGRLSHELETAKPELSETAWNLAVAITNEYGVTPSEAVRLLE